MFDLFFDVFLKKELMFALSKRQYQLTVHADV